MTEKIAVYRPLRAKLIFNATAGQPEDSPRQLAEIVSEMQNWNILPEVYMVRSESKIEEVVRSSIRRGIKLVVVAGGDGTIDSVAGAVVGSNATLGIIPTGTRNNVGFNLGIGGSIAAAVALLREGRRLKIDVGNLNSGGANHWFLEAAAMGLLTDLYPAADNIQHGDLAQIGNLLSTFVASAPSQLRMVFDGNKPLDTSAYMVLIANMPYIGPRFQISPSVSYNDGYLDVFVFSDMTKLDLLSYAMQSTGGAPDDERIQHFRTRRLTIQSDPPMPVLADGILLEQGLVTALVHPCALMVMAGAAEPANAGQPVYIPVKEPEVVPQG